MGVAHSSCYELLPQWLVPQCDHIFLWFALFFADTCYITLLTLVYTDTSLANCAISYPTTYDNDQLIRHALLPPVVEEHEHQTLHQLPMHVYGYNLWYSLTTLCACT